MQDKIASNRQLRISPELQEYINELVKEVVLNGKDFNSQKKWLKKYATIENVDVEKLIFNLEIYFDQILKSPMDISSAKLISLGESVYISYEQTYFLLEQMVSQKTKRTQEFEELIKSLEKVLYNEEELNTEMNREIERVGKFNVASEKIEEWQKQHDSNIAFQKKISKNLEEFITQYKYGSDVERLESWIEMLKKQ